jgi:hypothetical protein
MPDQPQLDRIEQLLREGNELRRQAIGIQQESIALQKSLVDEQRANLAQASRVNDQAMAIQQKARRAVGIIIPILLVLVAYVSWLLFFRPYL